MERTKGGIGDIPALARAFLLDVLEALSALRPDAPVLIMGDLNIEPHDSPVITEAVSKGILVDLGAKCGPTFFPSQGRQGRLDAILATRAATVAFAQTQNIECSGLPGHIPLAAELQLSSFNDFPQIAQTCFFSC